MSKVDIQAIEQALEGKQWFNGCMAYYARIDDEWGIKVYRDEDSRDIIHEKHKIFRKKDVGPKVGAKVTLTKGVGWDSQHKYGFILEHCRVPSDEHDNDSDGYDDKFWRKKRKIMFQKVRRRGITWMDCGNQNWGLNQKGEPVIIDLGCGLNDMNYC
jgi:hypothetical protein